MRARMTRLAAALAALAALAIGGAAFAAAQGNGVNTRGAAEQEREDDERSPSYRSSITAPDQESKSEQAEAQALRSKATITAAEARRAALAAVAGTARQVELDNENGNVVYSVEITKADGSEVDVKVDAGNAKVLHQEADDEEAEASQAGEADENDESEADEPAGVEDDG